LFSLYQKIAKKAIFEADRSLEPRSSGLATSVWNRDFKGNFGRFRDL